MKAVRLLKFLIGLTALTREHGVTIKGNELIIDDRPEGQYMVDPNNPGAGAGIEFKWEAEPELVSKRS